MRQAYQQHHREVNSRLQTTDAEASSTPLKSVYSSPKVKPVLCKEQNSWDKSSQQHGLRESSWFRECSAPANTTWFLQAFLCFFFVVDIILTPTCSESEGALVDCEEYIFITTHWAKQQSILQRQKLEHERKERHGHLQDKRMQSVQPPWEAQEEDIHPTCDQV